MPRRALTSSTTIIFIALITASIFAAWQETVAQEVKRGLRVELPKTSSDLPPLGNYYALLIGINSYQSLPRLKTAVADATSVSAVLKGQFEFETKLLLNASRSEIIAALNEYRRRLGPNDNLLIYYAGHGYRDAEVDKAYWLPVDADKDITANWISADDITTAIKGITARHILIVSDSCYSGMIYRKVETNLSSPVERGRYLRRVALAKSRHLLSSGSNEPVADGGGTGHSVFASALLKGLWQMDREIFTAQDLYVEYIRESVPGRSEQLPQYSPLFNSGHDGGEFIFARMKATIADKSSTTNQPLVIESPQTASLAGLILTIRRSILAVSPGQQVQVPLTITNNGPKGDHFRIETDLPAEFQPAFSIAQDSPDKGMPTLITGQIDKGRSLNIFLNLRIPGTASDAQQYPFFVRATSGTDSQTFKVASVP